MSLNRYNARRDKCEKAIVDALQAQGFHVTRLSGTKGLPDLLVSRKGYKPVEIMKGELTVYPGHCWLVEVKTPKGRYTSEQKKFHEEWAGPPIITLRSVDDALKFKFTVGRYADAR